jgi:trans-2,3-dihydro-3-hydroxyanthranilate isomerase
MRRYRFHTCDVFTDTRFGGNPLAVFPEGEGLADREMQQIAREFNFSETTFVLPSSEHARRVRIFTPTTEVPFAGHPNVGTAFVLATTGAFGELLEPTTVVFEEEAGPVPVTIHREASGALFCELEAPEPLSLGEPVSPSMAAAAVSLTPAEVVTATHPPREASVGLPFLVVELRDRGALEKARPDPAGIEALAAAGISPDVHLYVQSDDELDVRARMFAPLDGVPEDPATGSANSALAALLTQCRGERDGLFEWRIAQGVEMGRPSLLVARTEKKDGEVVSVRMGGRSVLVTEGVLHLD